MLATLKQVFGFDTLRPGQEAVIGHLLNGQSAAAIFPTGSGKSLCYQLPAVMLPHLTLVVSPLLALMKDQLAFLRSKQIPAATIDSTLSYDESQQVMRDVRSGTIKVLMISVERLKNERFRQFISQVPISLLVVDEAHCISEWGHNFRPDYLKLPHYREALNIPQALLLTATATPAVIADMRRKFAIDEQQVVSTGFYRPNLDLAVKPVTERDKPAALRELLSAEPAAPTIVYVTLQKTAETVAAQLSQAGIPAQAYHAGMKSEVREQIQQRFMDGSINCIVATIAFGMGIDKSDIRRVVHYDLPKSIENYSQEIGRAGRDGERSHCSVLACKSGLTVLENFVYGDTPDRDAIAFVLDEVALAGDTPAAEWEVILTRLSKESNIRLLALKTLLVYLEMEGIISAKYTYFADYRFKCNWQPEAIVGQFAGERAEFVDQLFRCCPKARTWHTVDFDTLFRLQIPRQRVVSALDYFAQQGWIVLESKQATEVYRVARPDFERQALCDTLYQLFANKEQSEIQRIHNMIGFFESERCLSHSLAEYFADHQAPQACGHCSVCRGSVATLPGAASEDLPAVSDAQLQAWCQPFQAKSDVSLTPQALTRFLCGISSPLHTRLKASQLEGFGRMEAYPFAEVLGRVESLCISL